MALKIFTIIKRNLLILYNSKISSLILVLGPLFLILIVGSMLKDTSIKNIKAGVYCEDKDSFCEDFLVKLKESRFIAESENSLESCKQKVISWEIHLCIEITKEKSSNRYLMEKLSHKIILHVDFSKQRVVWQVIGRVKEIIDIESGKIKDSIIVDVRNNIDDILISSEKIEEKMIEAEGYFNTIDYHLDDISRKVAEVNSGIDSISADMKIIKLNIDITKEKIRGNFTEGVSYLEIVEREIDEIEAIISAGNQSFSSGGINTKIYELKEELSELKNKIILLKEELREKQRELENIKELDLNRAAEPIPVSYKSVGERQGEIEKELGFLDYLFPSFLILYIMFSSLLFSSLLIIRERLSGAHVRNILSNTSGTSFILGNFISCFLIVVIQMVIIVAVGNKFLNINLFLNFASLFVAVLLSAFVFIFFGMAIGYLFNSQESASLSAVSVGIIFLIFSSLITPREILPEIFSKIVSFSPFSIFENKFISVIIFGSGISFSVSELIGLVLTFLVLVVLLGFSYRKAKGQEIR